MYHVSAQGVDERMINVHYYYYYYFAILISSSTVIHSVKQRLLRNRPGSALRPLTTSFTKDYKAHSLQQTSFAESPNSIDLLWQRTNHQNSSLTVASLTLRVQLVTLTWTYGSQIHLKVGLASSPPEHSTEAVSFYPAPSETGTLSPRMQQRRCC